MLDIMLNDKPEGHWDFKDARKEGVHSIGKYPATMVAQMQFELLDKVIESLGRENITVLDPFMGSGTCIVEGQSLGVRTIGIDINPYAILLSQVKTTIYSRKVLNKVEEELREKLINNDTCYSHFFPNINKWFRGDIILSLTKVRTEIQKIKNKNTRNFLWVCLSEVIFKYSNSRTTTFKLHTMKYKDIERIENNVENYFLKIVKKNIGLINTDVKYKSKIIQGDSIEKMKEISSNSISVICTSPPYGDNQTTVTYGQFSILALKWIDQKDLTGVPSLTENYSRIDSVSLGGKKREVTRVKKIKSINNFLKKISIPKQQKVINFFEDYLDICQEMVRVTSSGGIIMMTVGNRSVDKIKQPLDTITIEIMEYMGMKTVSTLSRKIINKRMAKRVMYAESNDNVELMNNERVLLFEKG